MIRNITLEPLFHDPTPYTHAQMQADIENTTSILYVYVPHPALRTKEEKSLFRRYLEAKADNPSPTPRLKKCYGNIVGGRCTGAYY